MKDFKPQNLGITLDSHISTSQIIDEVSTTFAADKNNDIAGPNAKTYMLYLMERAIKGKSTIDFNYKLIDSKEMNSILKDFGEILGAIHIVHDPSLFPSLKIKPTAKIFFPRRGNEPLMDYKIDDLKFSAKAGKTTNTIKPSDILQLIDDNKSIYKKVESYPEYKVLQFLDKGSMVGGTLMATGFLLQEKIISPTPNITMKKLELYYNEANTKGDKIVKNRDPQFIIECEKQIVNWSRSKAKFQEFFFKVIEGKIFYMKLDKMDSSHHPQWSTLGEDAIHDMKKIPVLAFRSKNSASFDSKGNARISDKLGLQM